MVDDLAVLGDLLLPRNDTVEQLNSVVLAVEVELPDEALLGSERVID